jgi:phosphoribosylformylglycinamidine synthase
MAERGDVGVTIDVTKVPVREQGMTPYEILLSESQERMLVVAKLGHEDDVRAILSKWDLEAAVIGEVIAEPVYRVTEGERVVAEFPGSRLVTECPQYVLEPRESDTLKAARGRSAHAVVPRDEERDHAWTLERLLSSPTIASKKWVWQQYDSTVRTSTVRGPGSDAAVVKLRGTDKAIALCIDGNGRHVALSPRNGGRAAVAEAARNVACTGARPMAITNNLNFGNPKKPEVYFQLSEAIAGMGEACTVLETPVTGGNVSLYNENPQGAIHPTPTIGLVGLIESLSHVTPSAFQAVGDDIVLLGDCTDELGASGVRANAVRPGLVPTDATVALTTTDVIRDDYLAQMPLARTGTDDDVAALVRFLLGSESGWITGQCIGVDGGHSLRRGPDLTPVMDMVFGQAIRPPGPAAADRIT